MIGLDDLEKTPMYKVGLWYSSYVKIYSIGGHNRVAELSSYPRAYQDNTPHIYTDNKSFTVKESDLNNQDRFTGNRFFIDTKENAFLVGERATHWKGDPLPGAFPLWLADEGLEWMPDRWNHVFPIDKMPRPINSIRDAVRKQRTGEFVHLSMAELESLKRDAQGNQITIARVDGDEDKQVLRIQYQRRL